MFKIVLLVGVLFAVGCQPNIDHEDLTPAASLEPENTPISTATSQGIFSEGDQKDGDQLNPSLTFWHPFSGRQAELVVGLVEEYNRENGKGIKIAAASHSDDEVFISDLRESLKNDTQPDIIIAPSYYLKQLYIEFLLYEIDGSIYPGISTPDGDGIFRSFSEVDIEDGFRYGIPYLQLGHFLFYNSTWAEELGYTQKPVSVIEFIDQICAGFEQLRFDEDPQNNGTGGYFFFLDSTPMFAWMESFEGGPLFNPRGDVVVDTEQNVKALSFLYQLYTEDCAWWSSNEQFPYKYFANRNAIMYSGRIDEIATQAKVNSEQNSLDKWMMIPYPSVSGKPIVIFENYSFALVDNSNEEVNKSAADFIQWMLEPDQHVEMIYLTGAFPLNTKEIQEVEKEWDLYAIWLDSVQYIPFSKPFPQTEKWSFTKKVLEDLSWQIIQFTVDEADISLFLRDAETIINTMIAEN